MDNLCVYLSDNIRDILLKYIIIFKPKYVQGSTT